MVRLRHPASSLVLTVLALGSIASSLLAGENAQPVTVLSSPSGARVTVDGEERGRTPLRLRLAGDRAHDVLVEREGYAPHVAELRPVLNVRAFNRAILTGVGWGLVQASADLTSGRAWRLAPGELLVRLEPHQAAAAYVAR